MAKNATNNYRSLFRRLADPDQTEAAIAEIFDLFHGELISYLTRLVPNDDELVKDLVEDLLVELCEHPEQFADKREPKSWLFTVAKYKTKNYLRKASRRLTEPLVGEFVLESDLDADSELKRKELEQVVLETVQGLTDKERKVFMCRWDDGLSAVEIAERYGNDTQTIKNQLSKALHKNGEKIGHWMGYPVNRKGIKD